MAGKAIEKRHQIYQRILMLVDTLAPLRRGISTNEVCSRINDRLGESYSSRTIYRDLQAMQSLGYVRCESRQVGPKQGYGFYWSLNLAKSENLQAVAFEKVEAA
jgi:predicted DNA-binding transcriptional regulator YafY